MQGSVPPLTPSQVVCIWIIAPAQLQVATVKLLSLGTTTLTSVTLLNMYLHVLTSLQNHKTYY